MAEFPQKLSNPAKRALANAGLTQLEDLSNITERDFKKLHGIGPSTLIQLHPALKAHGLSFK